MDLLDRFHQCVVSEVVPAVRADSGGGESPIVVAGASIGAFNAVAVLCRFPRLRKRTAQESRIFRAPQANRCWPRSGPRFCASMLSASTKTSFLWVDILYSPRKSYPGFRRS